MPEGPLGTGIYNKLDASKRQIRLLQIASAKLQDPRDGRIECHLTKVSLDDIVEFDALSYAWGDPHDRVPVQLNGFEFLVTTNLHCALQSFRNDYATSGYLWIDAMCVNQADLEERSQQVSIMGHIFRKARNVHIWLGLEGKHSIETIEAFKRIQLDGLSAALSQISQNVLDGLEDLLSRAWWSRVWVIPEAVVAKDPVAHLGRADIPFHDLLSVLKEFVKNVFSTDSAELSVERQTQLHQLCDRIFDVYNSFNFNDLSLEFSCTIMDVLRLFNGGGKGEATDPHDHVYALLGILPSSIAITPDYTTTVGDLYRSTTMRLMLWSNSLAPLCKRVDNESKDLPSWAADFRCSNFGVYTRLDFDSCPKLLPLIEERTDGQLYVYAKIIDYVEACSERCPEVASISGLGQDLFEDLRRVLSAWLALASSERSHSDPDPIDQAFWRTVVQNSVLESSGQQQPYSDLALGVSEIENWVSKGIAKTTDKIYKRLRMVWVQNVDHVFFTTKDGRYGVTDGSPSQDDAIALLAGSNCPFVLRPVIQEGGQCYKIVGACYCDGVMYGEAIPSAQYSESSTAALDFGFEETILI